MLKPLVFMWKCLVCSREYGAALERCPYCEALNPIHQNYVPEHPAPDCPDCHTLMQFYGHDIDADVDPVLIEVWVCHRCGETFDQTQLPGAK